MKARRSRWPIVRQAGSGSDEVSSLTASDLYRWLARSTRGSFCRWRQTEACSRFAPLGPGYGYGLGWFVPRADSTGAPRVVFHGGRSTARTARADELPSGRVMIALTNVGYRGRSITRDAVERSGRGFARFARTDFPLLASRDEMPDDSLVGEYESPAGGNNAGE